jgi:hypothetical protein
VDATLTFGDTTEGVADFEEPIRPFVAECLGIYEGDIESINLADAAAAGGGAAVAAGMNPCVPSHRRTVFGLRGDGPAVVQVGAAGTFVEVVDGVAVFLRTAQATEGALAALAKQREAQTALKVCAQTLFDARVHPHVPDDTTLSDLHIVKKIGGKPLLAQRPGIGYSLHGVCAAVYLAHLPASPNSLLAVKVAINMGGDESAHLEEQFANEHNMLEHPERLPRHPNIVVALHSFNDDATALPGWTEDYDPEFVQARTRFVVFPFMNKDLKNVVSKAASGVQAEVLPKQAVIVYAVQLLRAVAHLKEHKLVHRDLKLDNIMLGGHNLTDLTVIDFGLVMDCASMDAALGGFAMQYPQYMAGFCKGGSPYSLAPEVASAKPGAASVLEYGKNDAWAAGLVMWKMMSRDEPFGPDLDSPTQFVDGDLLEPPAYCAELREAVQGLLTVDFSARMDAPAALALLEPLFPAALEHMFAI